MKSDFPSGILRDVAHRPWPLPKRPWVMKQSWHDLLFVHWPIAISVLRPRVPPELELDAFDGLGWLAVVPFHMTNVAPRALPVLPWVSAFAELNVRTYVTHQNKPGVYFFSLDAANSLAVATARAMFHLPYYRATMSVRTEGGWINYESRRTGDARRGRFKGRYRPVGPVFHAAAGTLQHFLTERYCLYTVDRARRVRRLEIHHPPWPLQPAEASIEVNTMPDANGITGPATPPLLHFAKRQDVVAWLPETVTSGR
jgi:uncharacterized protein